MLPVMLDSIYVQQKQKQTAGSSTFFIACLFMSDSEAAWAINVARNEFPQF